MKQSNPPVPSWFANIYHTDRERIAREMKIADEKRYFDVMTADPKKEVRMTAVRRLTDQSLIREAAEHDEDEEVREEAIKKLTDQELLFRMIFLDMSEEIRLEASMALRDDYLCFRTVRNSPTEAIRMNAAANMKDQQLLARIIREVGEEPVRKEAAERITDPALAEKLFREIPPDREHFLTARAVLARAIQTQAFLKELALTDPDIKVRQIAAGKLTDQDLLMQIIRDEGEYDEVRAAAAGQITDQAVLRELADTYYHKLAPYDIGEEALKHIEDQDYLKSVAEDHGLMHCLRKAAATHVTDQEILFDWALHENDDTLHDIGLAGIAVRQLTNPEYLAKTAVAGVDNNDISERAIERLHDDAWLLYVIDELGKREDAEGWWVRSLRNDAAMNIRDPAPLVERALKENNDEYDMMDSFERTCLCCIAESPSAMHDYASRFTNPEAAGWAIGYTMNRYGLEGFLENPLQSEGWRESVLTVIGHLDRLHEIGMAEKQ